MTWQRKKLGEVCVVGAGNSAPQKMEFFVDGKYPFFRTSDVGAIHLGEILEAADHLNDKGIKNLRLVKKGTILFPKSGASTFLDHRVIMGVDGYVSSHLATIATDERILDSRFLFYFLQGIRARDLIQDHGYPSLNLPVISGIQIPLPPLPDQLRIVKTLDSIFEKVSLAKQNVEKNLQNSRELFESYLQKIFANPGQGWEEIDFGDIILEVRTGPFGSALHKSDYVEEGVPVINPQNIVDGTILPRGKTNVSEATKRRLSQYVLRKNDIILARRGEMGRCALVTNKEAGWLCGTGSLLIRLKSEADVRFLLLVLQSARVSEELEEKAIGATMSNLNQGILNSLKIVLPPFAVQCSIVTKLDALSAETKKLEAVYTQKLADFEELKKSVLNKAFSGEL
ncbi:restriction endonuclease subunit S [Candidatus Uhrbacteria bacterium]|nr:restriction endonuclease subunit S [Candidatus Uhrbacteria bacterium]